MGSSPTEVLAALDPFGPVLALKLYRLSLEAPPPVPTLPCLDHEVQLHETVAPHVAVYIQERASGDLHEVAVMPSQRRIDVDAVSTLEEHSPESHARLLALLAERFPGYRVHVHRASSVSGDRRVVAVCRAQVTLREVLLGVDMAKLERRLARLQVISTLMEKQSRVASWGVRTVTGPVLAAAAFLTYQLLGTLAGTLSETAVAQLRYGIVGVLGATFLYYGLKAVQLTGMSNRLWKRWAEYSLILEGRKRLNVPPAGGPLPTR